MRARSLLPLSGLAFSLKKMMTLKVLFLYYWYLFIYRYRSTIYSIIDRDKQEKKEAESNIQVDKVELVL